MTILVQQQLREATERLICEGENCWPATVERFTELANPAAVLALLDEVDRLTRAAKYCEDTDATHENHRETMLYDLALERDQLQAENADLRRGQSALEAIATMPADQIRETYNQAYYAPREIGSDAEQIRAGMTAVLCQAMTKEQP